MPRGDGTGPMGRGSGGGKGQGKGGQRAGCMGGSAVAGLSVFCVCPQCGEKEVHQRGIPCNKRICPKCGTPMIRQ